MILLTSAGLYDAARLRRAGIHAALLKPVKQSDLLDTIVTTLGGRPAARDRPLPSTPRPRPRRLRVLLVEDNRVNQTMALRILRRRGHHVTVTGNGREALEVLRPSDATPTGGRSRKAKRVAGYDVVLMDVQMPVMNGLEATARIRREEQERGGHMPIVAMTAHAMHGDRERCLAAGMDGYLVKPMQAEDLIAAVESFAASRVAAATDGVAAKPWRRWESGGRGPSSTCCCLTFTCRSSMGSG